MGDFISAVSAMDEVSIGKLIEAAALMIPADCRVSAKSRVSGGIRLLNREDELNDYLVAFGEIHCAKLLEFLPHLPYGEFGKNGIAVIDWGCGQGLAAAVLMDYLRERHPEVKIRCFGLVEIAPAALKRAEVIVKRYVRGTDVSVEVCPWSAENIERIFADLPFGVPVLHLFSNILDVRTLDVRGVRRTVERLRTGRTSYVVSCGPDMETKNSSPRQLLDFLQSFCRPRLFHVFPNRGGGRIYGAWKYWPYDYCKCYGFAYSLSAVADAEKAVGEVSPPALPPPVMDPDDIFMYASIGSAEELESLVKAGVDVNYRNEKGATPLYFAAKYGSIECVKVLLAAGADTELKVRGTGFTPYLIAVKYERRDVIAELKGEGCNAMVRDFRGRNAVEIVRAYGLGLKKEEL